MTDNKRRRVTWFHRKIANPLMRRVAGHLPGHALLRTVGRRSGLPRDTPVGGRLVSSAFWFVSDHGYASAYVLNIQNNPAVQVQVRGRWRAGTAVLLPEDDARERLRRLPRANSFLVRTLGTQLLTVRIDLEQPGHEAIATQSGR
jgi:deazaflavin-dependent oxidoreductase (nitroreductase family)